MDQHRNLSDTSLATFCFRIQFSRVLFLTRDILSFKLRRLKWWGYAWASSPVVYVLILFTGLLPVSFFLWCLLTYICNVCTYIYKCFCILVYACTCDVMVKVKGQKENHSILTMIDKQLFRTFFIKDILLFTIPNKSSFPVKTIFNIGRHPFLLALYDCESRWSWFVSIGEVGHNKIKT